MTATGAQLAAIACLTGLMLACGDDVVDRDHSVNAVLTGVVTRASGTPIPGVRIAVTVVDSSVPPFAVIVDETIGVTDASGHFARLMSVFLWPEFEGHVSLTARPPNTLGLSDSTLNVGRVWFRIDSGDFETLTVTIAYP